MRSTSQLPASTSSPFHLQKPLMTSVLVSPSLGGGALKSAMMWNFFSGSSGASSSGSRYFRLGKTTLTGELGSSLIWMVNRASVCVMLLSFLIHKGRPAAEACCRDSSWQYMLSLGLRVANCLMVFHRLSKKLRTTAIDPSMLRMVIRLVFKSSSLAN